jgi:hypothetical protein
MGCDKNVIVLRSYPVKTVQNAANLGRYICLRNIVESEIFTTRQNCFEVSGTRGRAFESPQARHLIPCDFNQFC